MGMRLTPALAFNVGGRSGRAASERRLSVVRHPVGKGGYCTWYRNLLLNLVGVMGDATKEQVWGYLGNYVADATPKRFPELDRLIDRALAYGRDFVAPTLKRRAPEGVEVAALERLDAELAALPADADAETIQNIVYEIGKTSGFENLRDWFKALYETLLGSSQGPRMGSFIALYGIDNSRTLIAEALEQVEA